MNLFQELGREKYKTVQSIFRQCSQEKKETVANSSQIENAQHVICNEYKKCGLSEKYSWYLVK